MRVPGGGAAEPSGGGRGPARDRGARPGRERGTGGDGAAGPDVVNGDWWSSGNGGVVAAADQTTATGTDGISGYLSAPAPAASALSATRQAASHPPTSGRNVSAAQA